MKTYFKDQRFLLIYAHCETGLGVENLGACVTDASSGVSRVISARGSRKFGNTEFRSARTEEDRRLYEMHARLRDDLGLGDGELNKKVQEVAPEQLVAINQWATEHTSDRLIFLAYDDGDALPASSDSTIVAIRRGGAELVAEFLLSKFASPECVPVKRWIRIDGQPITDEEQHALRHRPSKTVDRNLYRREWTYDFSLLDNFYDLTSTYEVVHDWDDIESFERAILNIDQTALGEMHDWIRVPPQLRELLTPEQDRVWRDEVVPGIIREHLDFIGKKLFGQALDDSRADAADESLRREGEAWNEHMREFMPSDD